MEQRGAAREAGGGPCDGASSPVVPAHGRVTRASSGRPVEPAAGVLSTQPAKWLCALEGTAPHAPSEKQTLCSLLDGSGQEVYLGHTGGCKLVTTAAH